MSKPRIILDIGSCGQTQDLKSASRGVQRVVHQLFHGLRRCDEFEVTYVATDHVAGAYDFLASENLSPKSILHHRPAQLWASRFSRPMVRRYSKLVENRSLSARVQKRLLAEAANFLVRSEADFDPRWFETCDIYHAPHMPFPKAVHEAKHLKKFLTLHDFIPLKNPEYYATRADAFVNGVLGCLIPGNFAFSVSEYTRNDALNYSKISPENIFVTPLAADAGLFYPETDSAKIAATTRRLGIPQEPYFLSLSAHYPHKNFPHLIRCFGELVESGELTDTNLVVVGPNPGRNALVRETLARYPRAQARVVIPGFIEDQNLAGIYSGAVGFLFPSLAEGFGIPPLEAMQCGLPVIASNTTSIPEVVGDAGILLPPTDQDAWCQAMLRVRRDEALRAEMRQKSLQRSRLFSWERFMAETLRGYRAALAQRG